MNQLIASTLCCEICGADLEPDWAACPCCGEAIGPRPAQTQAQAQAQAQAKNLPALRRGIALEPVRPRIVGIGGPLGYVLKRRWAIVAILLTVGPLGLPALWFSERFSKLAKILTTVGFFLGTVVLPLAVLWYWLNVALRPLVDTLSGAASSG